MEAINFRMGKAIRRHANQLPECGSIGNARLWLPSAEVEAGVDELTPQAPAS